MGVVYYGRYYDFFEAARNSLLREIGYPYKILESDNVALPVMESHCKYYSPARYDDEIRIVTTINTMPTVKITLHYKVFCNEVFLAEGYTIHSFVNLQKLKPVRPPEKFVKHIKKYFDE